MLLTNNKSLNVNKLKKRRFSYGEKRLIKIMAFKVGSVINSWNTARCTHRGELRICTYPKK